MKKEIIICDACGKTGAASIIVAVDRKMDAAGSMETWHETVDLCFDCTRKQLRLMLQQMNYDETRAWVARVRAERKT